MGIYGILFNNISWLFDEKSKQLSIIWNQCQYAGVNHISNQCKSFAMCHIILKLHKHNAVSPIILNLF